MPIFPTTLDRLIADRKISTKVLALIQHRLPDAIDEVLRQGVAHRPPKPSDIAIADDESDLKFNPVGTQSAKEGDDVFAYGQILQQVLAASPTRIGHLNKVAEACTTTNPEERISDFASLRLAIERQSSNAIYASIIAVILCSCALLAWLSN